MSDPFNGFLGRVPYSFKGFYDHRAVFSDQKGHFFLSDSADISKIKFGPFKQFLFRQGYLLVKDVDNWRINPGLSDELLADSISLFEQHFAAHTAQGVAIFQKGKPTIFHALPKGSRIWNPSGSFIGVDNEWLSVFSSLSPFKASARFFWWNDSLGIDTSAKGWKKLPSKKKGKMADSLKRLSSEFAMGIIKNSPFIYTAMGRSVKIRQLKNWKLISDTLLAIRQEEAWYLISLQGSKYKMHKAVSEVLDVNQGYIRIKSGKRFGMADCQGIIRIACRYDSLSPFEGDFCKAKIGSKWGVLDRDEHLIIQPNFDEILWPQNGHWPLKQGGKWALSNSFSYPEATYLYDHMSYFELGGWLVKKGNWFGWLGNDGNMIIPSRFQSIIPISPYLIKVSRENMVGIFNTFGLQIKELKYKKIVSYFKVPEYFFYY